MDSYRNPDHGRLETRWGWHAMFSPDCQFGFDTKVEARFDMIESGYHAILEGATMIFEALMESADKGQLILRSGAYCRYNVRRDGQLTIYEILVLPRARGMGIGRSIINELKSTPGVSRLVARCPTDLPSNKFWEHMGFKLAEQVELKSGRVVNKWILYTVVTGTPN